MKTRNALGTRRPIGNFRFSLARLIGVVAAIALALAAMVNASRAGAALLFTGTLVTLLTAFLGILYRRGSKRAFWVGFALLGWGYLLCAYGPWFGRNISTELVTTQAMTYVHAKTAPTIEIPASRSPLGPGFGAAPPPNAPQGTSLVPLSGSGSGGSGFGYLYPYLPDTIRVGHSLSALLLALLGGRLGAFFQSTKDKENPPPPELLNPPPSH